jgi:hypothetical protein
VGEILQHPGGEVTEVRLVPQTSNTPDVPKSWHLRFAPCAGVRVGQPIEHNERYDCPKWGTERDLKRIFSWALGATGSAAIDSSACDDET